MLNASTRELGRSGPAPSEQALIAETGCRLCAYSKPAGKRSKSAWERTFHACWDPNDSNLLYVFSQNGMLKILDTKAGSERVYHLLFRRFASTVTSMNDISAEEKPIRKHWDKVSLVPGKPGEILFLMGVSNTLHLTAVPGSTSPLAELTDATSANYVYGTPVMQIYTHASRITSLSMSPFGHVFSSGDENGYVNFINCMPPSSAVSNEPDEWWQCPSAAPSHSNPVVRAHTGPIFSMQWLPIFHKSVENSNVRTHYLSTGSEDRMVRLWKVTLGQHRGVSCEVLMILDTQSTHILCLKAIREPKPPKTLQRALSQWSQKRSASNMSPAFAGGGGGSVVSMVDDSLPDTDGAGGLAPIYLCAGTEHGSVYMWRFNQEDCGKRFEVTNKSIDDGTRLLAILHSSTRPIINIAMTIKREPPTNPNANEDDASGPITAQSKPTFGRKSSAASVVSTRSTASRWRTMYGSQPPPPKVLVCASDTIGAVRSYILHKQAEERDNMSYVSGANNAKMFRKRAGTFTSLQSFDPDHAGSDFGGNNSVFGRRRNNGVIEEEQGEIEGLMLTGESQFSSPVVACLFQEPRVINYKEEPIVMEDDTRENTRQVKFSNLASSLTDLAPPAGYIKDMLDEEVKKDPQLLDAANALAVVQAQDEIRFYPVSTLLTTQSARKNNALSALGAVLSSINDASESDDKSDDDLQIVSAAPMLQTGLFVNDIDLSERAETTTPSGSKKADAKRSSTPLSQSKPTSSSKPTPISELDTSFMPEPNKPPPAPSPQPSRANATCLSNKLPATGSKVVQPNIDVQNASGNKESEPTSTRGKSTIMSSNINAVTKTSQTNSGSSSGSGAARPVAFRNTNHATSEHSNHTNVRSNVQRSADGGITTTTTTTTTTLLKNSAINSTCDVAETSHIGTSVAAKKLTGQVSSKKEVGGAKGDRKQMAVSRLAVATSSDQPDSGKSSAHIKELLRKYHAAIADDESVVGSVHTTDSHRCEASRLVTNTNRTAAVYDDLISFGSSAIERNLPKSSTLKKQVDPAWLNSRQYDGPTQEHLRVLLPKQPRVDINIKLSSGATGKKTASAISQTSCANHGLRAAVDGDELAVHYTLDIDPTDLFGQLSTGLGPTTEAGIGAVSKEGVEQSWKKLQAIDYMLGQSLILTK